MPYYDYMCDSCGAFREQRPMREAALPQPCPSCGTDAERAILTAPRMSGMNASRPSGFSADDARGAARAHAGGCACCVRPSIPGAR